MNPLGAAFFVNFGNILVLSVQFCSWLPFSHRMHMDSQQSKILRNHFSLLNIKSLVITQKTLVHDRWPADAVLFECLFLPSATISGASLMTVSEHGLQTRLILHPNQSFISISGSEVMEWTKPNLPLLLSLNLTGRPLEIVHFSPRNLKKNPTEPLAMQTGSKKRVKINCFPKDGNLPFHHFSWTEHK